jgi:arginine decarboxylase
MGDADSPIIRLVLALEKFGKQFPGFEREVHGIEVGADGEYWMRSVIESSAPAPNGKKAASPARNIKRRTKKPVPPTSVPKGTI